MTNPNDSAYPFDTDIPNLRPGFSKKEEALLRFMCAIVSTLNGTDAIGDIVIGSVVKDATKLTEAYFNELNKSE